MNTNGSTFDTLLSLYFVGDEILGQLIKGSMTDFDQFQKLDGNNDAREDVEFSELTSAVERGQTYLIAVDGNNGEEGLINLNYARSIDAPICFPVKSGDNNMSMVCL
ncbi:MAG: hypothetical protein AAF402_04670 [Pseudomonadota bacterium]